MNPRRQAAALLQAAGVRTDADMTEKHRRRAAKLRTCFRASDAADTWQLASAMAACSDTGELGLRARAWLGSITRYPLRSLVWAWADPGVGDGQLDTRPAVEAKPCHPWDNPTVTPMGAVAGWWTPPRALEGIIAMSGHSGCGKSVAAVRAALQHNGTFIQAAEFGELALQAGPRIRELAQVRLLVIDELGRESAIGKTTERISEVLRDRHDQGLATIITTQLRGQDKNKALSFADRYGHHLLDRINTGGRWFEFTQGSRRQTQGRPCLDRLRFSCRVDYLYRKVTQSQPRMDDVNELQRLLEIDDSVVEEHARDWDRWQREVFAGMDALGDTIHAQIIARALGVGGDGH